MATSSPLPPSAASVNDRAAAPRPDLAAYRRLQRLTLVGVSLNVALAGVKLVAGLVGNSFALVADAAESTADVLASLLVWAALRLAARPADAGHPYGHGKIEPLAALVVSGFVFCVGLGIGIVAARNIVTPHEPPAAYTLLVLIVVVAVKEAMYRAFLGAALRAGSGAVRADAWHHRSDALTSLAAGVGIAAALLAGPGYEGADDVAALIAAGFICFNAARLMRPPLDELLDADSAELAAAARVVAERVAGVRRIEKTRARKSGLCYWIDMHVEVDSQMSVADAHRLAHDVKNAVREAIPAVSDVLVHVEPYQ